MSPIMLSNRFILAIAGRDRRDFLQGLITNDIRELRPDRSLYACLLNPQGKILFDFFLYEHEETILLDSWTAWKEELPKRLNMYKLRAAVQITERPELNVYAVLSETDGIAQAMLEIHDPRHPAMGRRLVYEKPIEDVDTEIRYEQHRLSLGIPDSADFVEGRAFTAEYGIAALHGVNFTKGCYVGQEVVARSRRGVLRKTLHRVKAERALPATGTIVTAGEKEIGQLRTISGTQGMAMLRLEETQYAIKNGQPLLADGVEIEAAIPEWFRATVENAQAM